MEKKTPQKTVHAWCHECIQDKRDKEVDNCGGHIVYATSNPCPFYLYRNGNKRISVKVFRKFCLECMGEHPTFVHDCSTEKCMIHPYRFGKNPSMVGRLKARPRAVDGGFLKKEALK